MRKKCGTKAKPFCPPPPLPNRADAARHFGYHPPRLAALELDDDDYELLTGRAPLTSRQQQSVFTRDQFSIEDREAERAYGRQYMQERAARFKARGLTSKGKVPKVKTAPLTPYEKNQRWRERQKAKGLTAQGKPKKGDTRGRDKAGRYTSRRRR